MNIAIVADWLPVFGGAEHVIAELHALWPDAPIFTTIANRKLMGPLADADIRTTPLQKWYRLIRKHQWLLPWMPQAVEHIDLREFDLIISSSHAVGKGIIPPSTARHICYCHTPMRYAWEMEDQYLDDFRIPKFLRRIIKEKLKSIRRWDLTSAKRVDCFIANSRTTQERIKRVYNRESTVIHPPVDERFFCGKRLTTSGEPIAHRTPHTAQSYYLAIGRLVPYKRFDLLIEAANALKLPLKIAGSGGDMARLKAMAGETVELLGFVEDAALPTLYGNAKALLFPPFEDAGVVPLEAQACGTPVIAYGMGGVLDTVKENVTGIFFGKQSVDALCAAIRKFETMRFDPQAIRKHAEQFRSEHFRKKILNAVGM